MTLQEILSYCLGKEGAEAAFPFGGKYPVVKLNGRIFAELFIQNGESFLTISTDAATAELLRLQFPDTITRGWHCPPVQARYKSTVLIGKTDDGFLKNLIDTSYDYIRSKRKKCTKEGRKTI